ncbi:hypothetical protein ACQP00_34935 [Dactylosporangium sp. CS-047395]|uniref:hypothetical protein n=1 Tax=Dactylosporangium sp. CS-047395 TaxID=3239936 RepID=UPI003D94A950
MGRRQEYAAALRALDDWAPYLREHGGLPGPRANLELAQAVADVAGPQRAAALIGSGEEYLALCGVVALTDPVLLRGHATDPRWRVREGVAMALQRRADTDLPWLLDLADDWAGDPHPLVQRAAVAGLCEPRLLKTPAAAARAVAVCAAVTASLAARPAAERRREDVRTLRKALGYTWSVAVAADRPHGLQVFERLAASTDPDVAWIVRENRGKARMQR